MVYVELEILRVHVAKVQAVRIPEVVHWSRYAYIWNRYA